MMSKPTCELHSYICSDEKANALGKFVSGNASVLVATNIIEVCGSSECTYIVQAFRENSPRKTHSSLKHNKNCYYFYYKVNGHEN